MDADLPLKLASQICSLFILIFMGFAAVKTKILGTKETKGITMLLLYIVTPCVIFMSYQEDANPDIAEGLLLAFIASFAVHIVFIVFSRLLTPLLGLSNVERAAVIYTNSGNLTIPLVINVMEPRAVMYSTAFLAVQTVLIWTHCRTLISGQASDSWKKIVFNINNFAILLGLVCFITGFHVGGPLAQAFHSAGNTIGPLAMFSIGVMLGSASSRDIFVKRNFLVSGIRLFFFPLIIAALFALWPKGLLSSDSGLVLSTILLSASAPAAVVVSQFALIYDKDYRSASGVNIITDFGCLISIPLMIWLFMKLSGMC